VVLGAIAMRNYDIEFDRFNHKLHFTKANCSKNWDSKLNPKHKNKNILQEISEPRNLDANVKDELNFSDYHANVEFNNDTNVSDKANNTDNIVDEDKEERSNSNNFLHSFLVITEN